MEQLKETAEETAKKGGFCFFKGKWKSIFLEEGKKFLDSKDQSPWLPAVVEPCAQKQPS